MIDKLDTFHQTRIGYLVFGLVELALAWWVGLKALDTGSLLWWALTIILLVGFLQNIVRLMVHKK
jgi:apolipoprotein N-acyltransferase